MAEAQTLTYDANEQAEGELTAEEQEALEVGEKLAEQQDQLLAGKFKDAEELEKGYIELQKKLGSSEEKTEEKATDTEDEEETETDFLDSLWQEAIDEKGFTEETVDKLSKMDPKDVAQMYLEKRAALEKENPTQELTEENVSQLKDVAGGEQQYSDMMQWAVDNLSENEVSMYDAVMDKGDPLSAFFAVQALKYRFDDSRGVDGQLLTGKAASNTGDKFRSQAEVVSAMNDPKYDSDPAYRQDIYDKLERSNIQF